jgi:hypothetical protein
LESYNNQIAVNGVLEAIVGGILNKVSSLIIDKILFVVVMIFYIWAILN